MLFNLKVVLSPEPAHDHHPVLFVSVLFLHISDLSQPGMKSPISLSVESPSYSADFSSTANSFAFTQYISSVHVCGDSSRSWPRNEKDVRTDSRQRSCPSVKEQGHVSEGGRAQNGQMRKSHQQEWPKVRSEGSVLSLWGIKEEKVGGAAGE